MTKSSAPNAVLRTVFLPLDLDNQIRDYAFSAHLPQADLIAQLVIKGLQATLASELLPGPAPGPIKRTTRSASVVPTRPRKQSVKTRN